MDERLRPLLKSLEITPARVHTVGGGDINDSYRIETSRGQEYFVKINRFDQSKMIIVTEARGLEMMKQAGVDIIPEDVRWAENANDACLVMPYYTRSPYPGEVEWARFFEQLAHMHRITHEFFGGEDNYIGLLPQDNSPRNNWVPFFRENRLEPQLKLAKDDGYFTSRDVRSWDGLFKNLPRIMPIERPALIHGDLWSGNVLSTGKKILLIDPCPHYGHREMDLGMMELFSGIPVQGYLPVYHEIYPLKEDLSDRIELYQLYYLLVHLNLFGAAYLPGVQRIIKKFSG